MNHNAKRALSIILAMLMCLGMFTGIVLPVSAAETTPPALPDDTIFVNLGWTASNTPKTITVNGKTFNLTWGVNAFNAPQNAVDATYNTSRETIYLCPGEYSATLNVRDESNPYIKKKLTILGAKYGIDPNVKGANENDLWTRNPARGEGETIWKGVMYIGADDKGVWHNVTDVTLDGLMLTGNSGRLLSRYGAANTNGIVKIAFKNLYIKDYTGTQAPIYTLPDNAGNDYQRDITIQNVRVENLTGDHLLALTAEKADISGVYMDPKCNKMLFETVSVAHVTGGEAVWNLHDNMLAAPVNNLVNMDWPGAGRSAFTNALAVHSKITTNIYNNVFVNCAISDTLINFRLNTEYYYYNFEGNSFYQSTPANHQYYTCIRGYATGNTKLAYGDQIKVKNNKFIGGNTYAYKFVESTDAIDLSGNYYEDLHGKVGTLSAYGNLEIATKQEWYWQDREMTIKSEFTSEIKNAAQLVDPSKDVKWTGRIFDQGGCRWFNWSNASFEFNIKGTGACAMLGSVWPDGSNGETAYLKVYVDGQHTRTIRLDAKKMNVVLASGLTDGEHTIKVVKRSNTRASTAGVYSIWVDEGTEILAPNKEATRKMQFVGDSITVGYGSMDWAVSGNTWTTATEDSTITYAALAGDYFGADYHTIAVSGRGIVKNNNKTTEDIAPEMYEYTDWNNKLTPWDHSKFVPDVIVINYGTNDKTAGVSNADFKAGAKAFVQQVRKDNPNAQIIYAYGFMGDEYKNEVSGLVNELRAAGDTKVHYLYLTPITESEKSLGHPTSAAHADRAEDLIAKVKEITGWDQHTTCSYNEKIANAATCAVEGCIDYTCKVCGDHYTKTIPVTDDHVASAKVIPYAGKDATCVSAGEGYKECYYCQKVVIEHVTIPATGKHIAGELIVDTPATCVDTGVGHKLCTGCPKVMESNITIPATGKHDYDNGVVTKKPTTTSTGIKTYTCKVCNGTKTEIIPKKVVAGGFTDVNQSDFFYTPVQWAVANGVTTGTTSTTFGAEDSCTRAQAVTFLWRAAGQPTPTLSNNPFNDVENSDYFYKAVLWAAANGITSGTTNTTFSPNAVCTRGQIVTFLWRAQGEEKVSAKNPFTDVKKSDFYYNAVLWAVKNGVTTGTTSTTFGPSENCTRGQIVTFLYRAVK